MGLEIETILMDLNVLMIMLNLANQIENVLYVIKSAGLILTIISVNADTCLVRIKSI